MMLFAAKVRVCDCRPGGDETATRCLSASRAVVVARVVSARHPRMGQRRSRGGLARGRRCVIAQPIPDWYVLNMFTEHVQTRAGQRAATREKVLDTAERLFRERGYAATTVRQIAAEAGVSTGSVMAVGDKAALLVVIFDGWIRAVHNARSVRAPESERAPSTSRAAIEEVVALLEPFLQYFMSDAALAREYASVLVRGDHDSVVFTELADALIAELASVLSRTGLGSESAEHGARAVYYLYLGVLMAVAGGAVDDVSAREQFRSAVAFTLDNEGSLE